MMERREWRQTAEPGRLAFWWVTATGAALDRPYVMDTVGDGVGAHEVCGSAEIC